MIVFKLICPFTKVIRKEKVKILGVFNLNWITECIVTQVDLTIQILIKELLVVLIDF